MRTPTINEQHEYITLKLGRRNLTVSYSGMKASSGIPEPVIDLWDKVTRRPANPDALKQIGLDPAASPNLGLIVRAFAAKIDTIWPDWAKEPELPKVGQTITADFGKRRGTDSGVVSEVKRNYVYAKFAREGHIGVHFDMIVGVA